MSRCWRTRRRRRSGKGSKTKGDLWPILRSHGYRRPSNLLRIGRTLDRAGDARFLSKSLFFSALMESDSPDQVVYSALMEALGYSRNRHPFFELAYSLTYSDLLRTVRAASASEKKSKRLEEVLIREAGLPGGPGADKGRRYSWTLSGVRPSNHPAKRIAGFSLVLERLMSMQDGRTEYDGCSLTRTMLGLADSHDNADAAIRALEKALMGLSADGDVEPAGPPTPVPIGKGRARDMLVNAVLPFLFALASADKDDTLTSRSLALFKHSPKLQENELTREAWSALFEGLKCVDDPGGRVRHQIVNGARRQQGLLHLRKLATSPNSPS